MTSLLTHLPALQIFIPIFFGFMIALVRSKKFASTIFKAASFLSFIVSLCIYTRFAENGIVSYNFGGFSNYVGIVFKIDQLNLPILLLANLLLFTVSALLLSRDDNLEYPIYSLMLVSYSAIFGILMTGDLFNLYVFLELYSIASAGLFAFGSGRKQFSAAFYYLVINTIAATLILLAIGFLLAMSGNLNMEHVQLGLQGSYNSRIVMAGSVLFAIGAICKSAVFPVHFWALSVYEQANSRIFLLLGALSTNVGFYILIRFAYFVVEYQKFFITYNIQILLQILGIMSVLFGSIMAYFEKDFRKVLIFSSVASAGYFAVLFSIPEADALQYACIYNLTDAILKIVMIVIATEQEALGGMGNVRKASKTLLFFTIINIMSSAGLPITMGFFNKIHFLRISLYSTNIAILVITLLASIFAVFYYYRLTHNLLFDEYVENEKNKLSVNRRMLLFIAIFTFISYLLLVYNNSMLNFYSKITDIIFIAADGS
jgi:multicomponent Na+:H+ antiporter subunit D